MPSSRVRVLNLLPELKKHGVTGDVIRYPKGLLEKLRLFKMCKGYDTVFLQKKLPSPAESYLLKRCSRRLVFDFDDAIYLRHDKNETLDSVSRQIKFKYAVKNADIVIAGNRILADAAREFNPCVKIIPSAVETRGIPQKDYNGRNDKVVIGWVGGEINLTHLKLLSETFQRLSREIRMEIRILCSKGLEIPGVDVRFIPWRLETQDMEISYFDIGVMPLPKTRHSEGKCGYKALQYMAASVPPVVSDVGVNGEIVENGKEGLVVSEINGFYDALKSLAMNDKLRKELGLNARKKVERYYSIPVVAKALADAAWF
ncbi:MAG: glycosyltransferase family 4 protein [Dissulfurimicrobium sp.]|uniref:glycosyltransferase family 4 protein n=1 Tax=Dissulfurimicrobium TaxID=1769732 RepID=UPI001EDBC3C7|nr:glycosyltransferase family 4 protein [Dissulfurimicrobium hydrothermale]UKL13130.1 glycosyltransferase family 4 protein [Dissulfurimicrobium hydrothermale]